jgi:hypothetical protein
MPGRPGEPEPDVHDALMEKIANAHPVIERAVRDFIQRQHEAGPEASSPSPGAKDLPRLQAQRRASLFRRRSRGGCSGRDGPEAQSRTGTCANGLAGCSRGLGDRLPRGLSFGPR